MHLQNKKLTRDTAKEKLKVWYKNVSESKIKELIAAKNTLKAKENEVLNYFVNYATNAAAESLNSKMKDSVQNWEGYVICLSSCIVAAWYLGSQGESHPLI